MYTLNPQTHKWDFEKLPEDLQLAWLGLHPFGNFFRLTADYFAFRQTSGSGSWLFLTLDELLPLFLSLSPAEPYSPPAVPALFDPLDLSSIVIEL